MAILVDEGTRMVVQGITGKEGQFHTLRNRDDCQPWYDGRR